MEPLDPMPRSPERDADLLERYTGPGILDGLLVEVMKTHRHAGCIDDELDPDGCMVCAADVAIAEVAQLRSRLAAAEERAARAERERDDTLTIRSCECGVEEACRLVRERDKARAEAARYREALERIADGRTYAAEAQSIARAALAGED